MWSTSSHEQRSSSMTERIPYRSTEPEDLSWRRFGLPHLQPEVLPPEADGSFSEEKLNITHSIGIGSNNEVYYGDYLGHNVAVKKLFPGIVEKNTEDSAFLNLPTQFEDFCVARKKSMFIVQLYHFSREKRYIVMEYCKNGSLYDVIRRVDLKPIVLDWKRRLQWMTHVALGMNVVHNQAPAVLHRDLKSSNIFIDEHWIAKVGDFGLSKPLRVGRGLKGLSSVEDLNMIWQAPEVRKDKKFSTKADVYSFGVIMHEMLLLKGPYGFDSSQASVDMRINYYIEQGGGLEVPEDRSVLPGRWHPCLERYISLMYWCCARNPDDRPEFDMVCSELKAIKKTYEHVTKETSNDSANSSPATLLQACGLLFVGTGFVGMITVSVAYRITNGQRWSYLAVFMIGLLCLIVLILAVFCLLKRRKTLGAVALRGVLKRARRSPASGLPIARLQHTQRSLPSPFDNLSDRGADGSVSSSAAIILPVPTTEIWKKLREGFINELQDETSEALVDLCKFCFEHSHEQLSLSEWEVLVRLLVRDNRSLETETWKEYQASLETLNGRPSPAPVGGSQQIRNSGLANENERDHGGGSSSVLQRAYQGFEDSTRSDESYMIASCSYDVLRSGDVGYLWNQSSLHPLSEACSSVE